MKRRNVILFIGIIVASIISTKSFADTNIDPKVTEIGTKEVARIIKTIKDNPEFSMFYKAIDQAELAKEIASLDKMTLMIPSNKAFKLLPADVWENFMEEDNKNALIELLNYHVIPKKVNYDDLKNADNLTTLKNQSVKLFHGTELKIENAVIQDKHEETSDVIIYKIDRLIMPLK
ncbi:fasciclin domain-containing protein [Marivirga sp.]|uniref:fasciclin domain-containing protein n=1 Tax=Marivirga sp. TaxID=2018662 RepID=UPI002D805355|nr:fasciclin domain-containing protein [Marivirga sp.]HET8860297.1 fasciclin domain-containing protein [Marivirga sp.]